MQQRSRARADGDGGGEAAEAARNSGSPAVRRLAELAKYGWGFSRLAIQTKNA